MNNFVSSCTLISILYIFMDPKYSLSQSKFFINFIFYRLGCWSHRSLAWLLLCSLVSSSSWHYSSSSSRFLCLHWDYRTNCQAASPNLQVLLLPTTVVLVLLPDQMDHHHSTSVTRLRFFEPTHTTPLSWTWVLTWGSTGLWLQKQTAFQQTPSFFRKTSLCWYQLIVNAAMVACFKRNWQRQPSEVRAFMALLKR